VLEIPQYFIEFISLMPKSQEFPKKLSRILDPKKMAFRSFSHIYNIIISIFSAGKVYKK
jgi:hypothetical protein